MRREVRAVITLTQRVSVTAWPERYHTVTTKMNVTYRPGTVYLPTYFIQGTGPFIGILCTSKFLADLTNWLVSDVQQPSSLCQDQPALLLRINER